MFSYNPTYFDDREKNHENKFTASDTQNPESLDLTLHLTKIKSHCDVRERENYRDVDRI